MCNKAALIQDTIPVVPAEFCRTLRRSRSKDSQSPSQFPTVDSIITWSKRNKSAEDWCHHSQDKKYQRCIILRTSKQHTSEWIFGRIL